MSILVAAALTGAAAAVPLIVPANVTAPTTGPAVGHAGGMAMSGGSGMRMGGAHDWNGGTGEIPTMEDALTKLQRRSTITIGTDAQFNPANGVRSGKGTFEDPFVISGWYVDTILVHDTTKAFEVKDDYVGTILIVD